MRTSRHFAPVAIAAVAALALGALAPQQAAAQQEYPATLYWGTGLVDIPVAWVSPLTGDFALNYSGKRFQPDPIVTKINYSDRLNSQLTFSMSFVGRAEVGVAAFSSNPEQGFFGRALLLREDDYRGRTGIARFLIPSLAVGARNVGKYNRIDRFGAGYNLLPPTSENPNAQHVPDSLHRTFDTNNSVYGVATKSFMLSEIRPSFPDVGVGFTVGYGNGLFKNYGTELRRSAYAKNATGGLFYGVKTDIPAGPNATVSLMAENNAWDFNVGGSLVYRGLRAGLYLTELGAGSSAPDSANPATTFYNYQKVAFTLGWQSNIFALLRGDFLQSRAARLERARQALLAEITARQQRIASLELELNRYEAQNLLELEQRRQQAEAQLRQEREALRRLEERLRRVESQNPGAPPTTPPPSPTQPAPRPPQQ